MVREIFFMLLSVLLILQYGAGCALIGSRDESDELEFIAPDDIVLGMPMQEVVRAWGEPATIYQAGGHDQGHQKWVYPDSSLQHLDPTGARVVYFENGHVVGWESNSTTQ